MKEEGRGRRKRREEGGRGGGGEGGEEGRGRRKKINTGEMENCSNALKKLRNSSRLSG